MTCKQSDSVEDREIFREKVLVNETKNVFLATRKARLESNAAGARTCHRQRRRRRQRPQRAGQRREACSRRQGAHAGASKPRQQRAVGARHAGAAPGTPLQRNAPKALQV